MRLMLYLFFAFGLIVSCNSSEELSSTNPVNWKKRMIDLENMDSLQIGETYLSVYSEIYSITEHRRHSLTNTISMRNISRNDSIFITKAEYFNTKGKLIRTYFDQPIYLLPMETVEIVINEKDREGGTGGNFLFE